MWLVRGTVAVIFLASLRLTSGYPEGPPTSACVDMMPGVTTGVVELEGHLAEPQNVLPTFGNSRVPPYYMTINKAVMEYSPGEQISISIKANQTNGMAMYKGLLLQARRVICAQDVGKSNETILVEDEPIGTFNSIPSGMLLKTMTCNDVANSAVCHRSPQFKINETVTWVAPSSASGHLVFRATIVQEAYIYWTSVHSAILQDPASETALLVCAGHRAEGYIVTVISLLLVVYHSASFS